MTDKIMVELEPHKLIALTSNDGGYLGGCCLVCGSLGWSNGPDSLGNLGTAKVISGFDNQLVHKKDCAVGIYISRHKS